LLRYIVGQTLDGRAEQLKERTIGVEAFGRAADYDTNADHSVRSAAGEVRRRLALYYAEFGADSRIRIELQPGCYAPQIRFMTAPIGIEGRQRTEPVAAAAPESAEAAPEAKFWNIRRVAVPAAIAALLISAISLRSAWQPRNPFDEFWKPVLASPNQALICVGGGRAAPPPLQGPALTIADFDHSGVRQMNVSDAMALVALTTALESKNKPFRILNRASNTSFKELQQGPFILVGAMNNEWTLRMTSGLRFAFEHSPEGSRIRDQQNLRNTSLSLNPNSPIDQPVRDYAIVTRLHDSMTEQAGVIVAGLGGWGTQAAAEFVSSPACIRNLASHGPANWNQKNVQAVIATDVIHGSSGPPILLDAWFW